MKTIILALVAFVLIIGGMFVFRGDNPQGAKQDVPTEDSREVLLYYYSENNDKDADGNVLCSDNGLVGVTRTVPRTNTPIQDVVKLLIKGELTNTERSEGLSTEFPLSGLSLVGASQNGGVLTLEFSDPENKTSGGSCRVTILRSQIEKTVMQFEGVESVVFKPVKLFQP